MTKLAVFDLDGTLIDTAPDLVASLNICLEAGGLPQIPIEVARPHAGHGAKAMLAAAYAHFGADLPVALAEAHLDRFLRHYEANIAETSRPFPGVLDAMERLEAAGWTLAVCTNKRERLAVKLLDELALSARFAAICGQDTFSGMKPDPVHLGGTIERSNGSPARTLMIGDTMTDIAAAKALDLPSILVDFGYAPDEAARDGATRVISNYRDLTPELAGHLIAGRMPSGDIGAQT
ncbi:HAD family hydrolase [Fulvimarina endophytica]|uniref:Phosphoglycolate phosphatase n=1 Tax=Fulvimarina endophytica TaxID=2293836 RepID=A0A371X766_9HYPH|nr:HAD hydrolase-like protein [Fulvimarina endophytica]RFC65068.1 HAD family hydrolase [Fulvimarina endophytica]